MTNIGQATQQYMIYLHHSGRSQYEYRTSCDEGNSYHGDIPDRSRTPFTSMDAARDEAIRQWNYHTGHRRVDIINWETGRVIERAEKRSSMSQEGPIFTAVILERE